MIRRFFAVLWKEWKSLQPFFYLLVALFIFGLILVQVVEFMDEYPIWDNVISSPNASLVVDLILCVIGVLGVLTREKDEGVLTYLDGLPVSRGAMYIAKGFSIFLMVAFLDILWTGEGLVYEYLSQESDSPPVPWSHVGTFLMLHIFLIAFFVAVLLPLSFLRFWLLLVLIAWAFVMAILKAIPVPYITYLDPFELMQVPDEIEDPWVIPWQHMTVLSVIGVFAWAVGLCLYNGMSAITGRKAREFWVSGWGKVLAVVGVIGSLVVILVLGVALSVIMYERGEIPEEPRKISGADVRPEIQGGNAIEIGNSDKFEFVYRRKMKKRVKRLLGEADEVYQKVANYFGVDEDLFDGRIVVDFSSPLGSHNAGQAYWKKIRMGYPKQLSVEESVAILGHEVAHVFINSMTGTKLEESFQSARWFHEGLASYVEFELFRRDGAADNYEHWLALSSTWGEVHFAEMVNDGVLSVKRDQNVAYPAGLEWMRAAIDVYGNEFAGNILRQIDRPEAPREAVGLALWRDACLAAGYDLERIRSRFRVRLKTLRESHREVCEKMPEIKKGKAVRKDGKIIITPELPEGWRKNAPKGAELVCRIRPDKYLNPGQWRYSKLKDGDVFSVSGLEFLKPRLGFQVGWKYTEWCDQPIFGEWVEVTIDK